MANTLLLKKSGSTGESPTSGELLHGELAINYADGKLFFKNSGNSVVEFLSSPGTGAGQVLFSNGSTFTGDSTFLYDDTNNRLAIGNTSPEADLHIGTYQTGTGQTATIRLSEGNGGGDSAGFDIKYVGGSDALFFTSKDGSGNFVDRLNINRDTGTSTFSGDVDIDGGAGIGIAHNSAYQLYIKKTSDNAIIRISDDTTNSFINVKDNYISMGQDSGLSVNNLNIKSDNVGVTKLGIGTVAPVTELHIQTASNPGLQIWEGTSVKGKVAVGGSGIHIGTITAHPLTLSTSNEIDSNTIRLQTDGKVGINTNSPETLGLHINKASTATSIDLNDKGDYHLVLQNSDSASTTAGRHVGLFMQINSNSQAADASIYTEFEEDGGAKLHFTTTKSGTGQERMVIDSDGNAGIGTTSPTTNLHVESGNRRQVLVVRAGPGEVASFTESQGAMDVDHDAYITVGGYFNTAQDATIISPLQLGYRNESTRVGYIKLNGGTDAIVLDASGNTTFGGTIDSGAITSTGYVTGTSIRVSGNCYFDESVDDNFNVFGASGVKLNTWHSSNEWRNALTLNTSQNATFAGTVTSGNITATNLEVNTTNPQVKWIAGEANTDDFRIYISGSGLNFQNTTDNFSHLLMNHDGTNDFYGNTTFTGDVSVIRAANAVLTVKATASGTGARLKLKSASNDSTYISYEDNDDTALASIFSHGSAFSTTALRKALEFKTGGSTTALTLDSSQNAIFAGTVKSTSTSSPQIHASNQSDSGNASFKASSGSANNTGAQSSTIYGTYQRTGSIGMRTSNFIIARHSDLSDTDFQQLVMDIDTGNTTFAGKITANDDIWSYDTASASSFRVEATDGVGTINIGKNGSVPTSFVLKTQNSSGSPVTALTVDSSQNATFAGTIGSGAITSTGYVTGTSIRVSGNCYFDESVDDNFNVFGASGVKLNTWHSSNEWRNALTLNTSQNATFAGTVTSGNITATYLEVNTTNPQVKWIAGEANTDDFRIYMSGSGLNFQNTTDNFSHLLMNHDGTNDFYGNTTFTGHVTLANTYAIQWGDNSARIEGNGSTNIVDILCAGTVVAKFTENGGNSDEQLQITNGLATRPSLSFIGDIDTGMYAGGTDTLDLATGGVNALTIDASQNASFKNTFHETNNLAKAFRGTVADVDDTAWFMGVHVNGYTGASSIRMNIKGSSNNHLHMHTVDILVGHYQDIYVKSFSGPYSQLHLKIESGSNEDYNIYFKSSTGSVGGAEAVDLIVTIEPLTGKRSAGNAEWITFTTTPTSYSPTSELIHTCQPGYHQSAIDGTLTNQAHMRVDGNMSVGTSDLTDTLHVKNETGSGDAAVYIHVSDSTNTGADAKLRLGNYQRTAGVGLASEKFVISYGAALATDNDDARRFDFNIDNAATILQGTAPSLTLMNTTQENNDGYRESWIDFRGEKADGTKHTLARIMSSQQGASDNYDGILYFKTNTTSSGADTLVEAMRLDSDSNATFAGAVTMGTTSGTGTSLTINGGYNQNPTIKAITHHGGSGYNMGMALDYGGYGSVGTQGGAGGNLTLFTGTTASGYGASVMCLDQNRDAYVELQMNQTSVAGSFFGLAKATNAHLVTNQNFAIGCYGDHNLILGVNDTAQLTIDNSAATFTGKLHAPQIGAGAAPAGGYTCDITQNSNTFALYVHGTGSTTEEFVYFNAPTTTSDAFKVNAASLTGTGAIARFIGPGSVQALGLDASNNALFGGEVILTGTNDILLGTAATSGKIRFGTESWNNSIGIESYWTVHSTNTNEGYKFKDSANNILLQLDGAAQTGGNGAKSATFAGDILQVRSGVNSKVYLGETATHGCSLQYDYDGNNLELRGHDGSSTGQVFMRIGRDQGHMNFFGAEYNFNAGAVSGAGNATFAGNISPSVDNSKDLGSSSKQMGKPIYS